MVFIGNYVGKEGALRGNLGAADRVFISGIGTGDFGGGSGIAGMRLGADNRTCNSVFNQTMFTVILLTVLLSIVAVQS